MIINKALLEISKVRDLIKTAEFAQAINKRPQTIRKHHCLNEDGTVYGITPVKVGQNLLWRVSDINHLITYGEKINIA